MNINEILEKARIEKCSDVHITEGLPITFRKNGKLIKQDIPLAKGDGSNLILSMCTKEQKEFLEAGNDLDFAYNTGEKKRYRVNVYAHMTGLSAAIRVINDYIPSMEDLNLPKVFEKLAKEPRGLVLLTGPTGSGKSTSLASMIDYITKNRSTHVLTIEDPIEYVFDQNESLVHQRELGHSVKSFAAALKSAMREDPDIILVGEMRDYETISTAITAAETGHLVFSTLNTTGAADTIDRIIDTCPPESQNQMRSQLSMVLRGVITQQLLPTADGSGRVCATEILLGTDAVKNLIREGKNHQIGSILESSVAMGMHTLNRDLGRLFKAGTITRAVAVSGSTDKSDLEHYL